MLDLAAHFSQFLTAVPGRLHFAAHSHHPWPDVTRAAQMQAWDNAARLMDGKWRPILDDKWPQLQKAIARLLNLPDPATLAYAPNTHEFVLRILGSLPGPVPRVLTTDGEFHSFSRQVARLEEEGLLAVTRVPAGVDAVQRLVDAARQGFDLIWVSEVFYSSGYALGGFEALAATAGGAVLVVDGYHGFMARPVDWSGLAGRAFYLSGGYKYAMGGEGCCFMHCPPGWLPRPRSTGWYAAFGQLDAHSGQLDAHSGQLDAQQAGVPYAPDGWRFMGATFDPSGIYRLHAALNWAESVGATPAAIHSHAHALQGRFIAGLRQGSNDELRHWEDRLVVPLSQPARGNFLTFELPDAEAWQARLEAAGIITDRRGTRLRFGFGLYQREADVDGLVDRMAEL